MARLPVKGEEGQGLKFPVDCPNWVETLFLGIEDSVGTGIEKAKTSDEAMRAAGAYGLWKHICVEFDMEAGKQEEALKSRTRFMNARR